MRPLTDALPKPLLTIQGKSLLQWHIEALASASIQQIVINHAWLGQKIESTFADGGQFGVNIQYSREASALETAGGINKALPLLSPQDYFLVINGDVFCPNFPIQSLVTTVNMLREHPAHPLAHLVMAPNPSQHPEGDFYLRGSKIDEKDSPDAEKLTFSGIGIYHKDLFAGLEAGVPIKLAPLLRAAMQDNRITGEKYLGPWHDVGTPQRLQELNLAYA